MVVKCHLHLWSETHTVNDQFGWILQDAACPWLLLMPMLIIHESGLGLSHTSLQGSASGELFASKSQCSRVRETTYKAAGERDESTDWLSR